MSAFKSKSFLGKTGGYNRHGGFGRDCRRIDLWRCRFWWFSGKPAWKCSFSKRGTDLFSRYYIHGS